MNWFSNLLRKPAPPSAPRLPAAPAGRPAADIEELRRALAAAGDAEKRPSARALGNALAELGQAPRSDDPPEVWAVAVCRVADKALALAWAAELEGDAWLGEVAAHGRFAEVRLATARRIEDAAVLERVAHDCRDKDKGVYRHCAELLRQRRQANERARRGAEIAGALRELLDEVPLPQARLLALEKELRVLGQEFEPLTECNALLDQARARLHREAEARRAMQASQAAATALLAECAAAEFADTEWPLAERIDGWRMRLASLIQAHAELPAWLAGQSPGHALAESLRQAESRLAAMAADSERMQTCEQFLAALAADMPLDAATAAAWDALPKPDHPASRASLAARWQALQAPLVLPPPDAMEVPPQAPPEPSRPRIDHDAVRGLLEQLERAVEEGHLADADAAEQSLAATLGNNRLHGALESRLQHSHAQLAELRGWARWGTGQAREHLIAAAEALLNGTHGVDDLVLAVPKLREEWKRLNVHGASAKGQWEQFDAALERAYQPVAARRAEEAARHAEARAAKEALCAEWEAWLAGMVWQHADYKVIEVQRQEMLKIWRAAPQSGFRDERLLRKRLDALLGGIDQRLDAARGAETERREQLIAAAAALGEAPDLGRAMTEAKALQERWRQEAGPLRLKRGDQEKLWRRFRAACDAVFARRDAQRAQQAALDAERTQARISLLDAFAAALAEADASGIQRAQTRFRADWSADGTGSRDPGDELEARARDLQQQAQRRLDALRQEKHHARFELLARKAALAEGVEAAALAATPLDQIVAAARQAWDEGPRLPGTAERLLAERLAAAASVTAAGLAAGREARAALLLDLEIALGLPSPEACAEARRERQLQQLQNRFGAGSLQPSEAETLLARWYATAATPDAALGQRMAAVVRKLVERDATVSR